MQTSDINARRNIHQVFSFTANTPLQVEKFNKIVGIPVEFRPLEGLMPSFVIEGGQTEIMGLWHTSFQTGFHAIPKFDADVVTIRFVTDGAMVCREQRLEHIGQPHKAMMVMLDCMRDAEFSSGFAAISASVTRSALNKAHFVVEGEDTDLPTPDFVPLVDATLEPLQNLKTTMEQVFRRLRTGVEITDLLFPLFEEVLMYRLLTIWPRSSKNHLSNNPNCPNKALNMTFLYIEENLHTKILLSDISRYVGVGVRSIQGSFKKAFQKTPIQYITDRRLDCVRIDLQASPLSDISIADIASRWGFVHMSDFSRRYRVRFGEAPSDTRRQRRLSRCLSNGVG